MKKDYKYFAFISYKREDEEWAKWLQHEIEHYKLPSTLNGRTDIPTKFYPIFRDVDELSAGNLPEQIYNALCDSANLIVICSPNSAKSEWVNKEISDFIAIGKKQGKDNLKNVFPFIVEGVPHSKNIEDECFPPILRKLPSKLERIGGNISETGRDKAFVQTLSGMLNVSFDELWNRYEQEKIEEERREREKRDKLLRIQSHLVVEKITNEDDCAKKLALILGVMPQNIDLPQRPYTLEAATALMELLDTTNLGRVFQHNSSVNSAVFSPDGKRVLTASNDKTACLWDAESGVKLKILQHNVWTSSGVLSAVFSPDGKRVLTASADGTACLWDVKSGEKLKTFKHNSWVNSAVFSPDGKKVLTASDDDTACLWDTKILNAFQYDIWVGSTDFNIDGEKLKIFPHDGRVLSAVFSPDGKRVLTTSNDDTACLWNAESREKLKTFKHKEWVSSVVFSPDGKRALTASWDRTSCLWDVESREKLKTFKHDGWVNSADFSPDGKRVLTASEDHTACLWDIESGVKLKIFPHDGRVLSAVFSPDGKRVLTASCDRTSCLWNAGSGAKLKTFKHDDHVNSAVFSLDGKRMLTASYDCTSCLWDIESGEKLKTFKHNGTVNSAVFSTDRKKVLTASRDYTSCLWNAESGEKLEIFKHDDKVLSAIFSPDEKKVLAVSINTTHIWDIDIQEFIDRGYEILNGYELSQEDKEKYYLE